MKSVNRTFRLDEDLLKTVHELAHQKKISMNEFVADSLRDAVADALMEGLDMEEVPGAFIAKIMEYVPAEKVAELGRWSAINFSRKFVWQTFKELSLNTIIKSYEVIAKKYQRHFAFEHYQEGSVHALKIRHSRGQKWSIYYAENMRSIFNDLLGVKIEVEWGTNEVRGRFIEPIRYVALSPQIPQINE
jgi:hypothetical protein